MAKLQIVIPSKGRPDKIKDGALRLFPDALVCIGADETDLYANVSKNLLVHPADVTGIGPLRQWILDNIPDDVVQVDDDVHTVYGLCGLRKRTYENPATVHNIVEQAWLAAREAGARVFGFNQAWDVRKYSPFKPFGLSSWAGGVVGVIGKERRFDMRLKLRADIDFCLQSLMLDRIVWIDNRFSFVHRRFEGSGGNASNRSSERHAAEIKYLTQKWGKYIGVQDVKTTTRIVVKVER